MSAILAWVHMGGYAVFVWPAYGLTAAVLAGFSVQAWRRHRQACDLLARLQRE